MKLTLFPSNCHNYWSCGIPGHTDCLFLVTLYGTQVTVQLSDCVQNQQNAQETNTIMRLFFKYDCCVTICKNYASVNLCYIKLASYTPLCCNCKSCVVTEPVSLCQSSSLTSFGNCEICAFRSIRKDLYFLLDHSKTTIRLFRTISRPAILGWEEFVKIQD